MSATPLIEPSRYTWDKSTYRKEVSLTGCAASVAAFAGHGFSQCQNRRKYGDWCGTHDPERAAARAKKRPPTRYERESAGMDRSRERTKLRDAVIAAAAPAWTHLSVRMDHDKHCPQLEALGEALDALDTHEAEKDS